MVVEAKVDEADIDRVDEMLREGLELGSPPEGEENVTEPRRPDEVVVTFEGLRSCEFIGRILELAQEPEERSNIITYDVRILLYPCADLDRVRLGMQGTVEFRPASADGVLVPYAAVRRRSDETFYVYVPPEKGGPLDKPEERGVDVGLSDGVDVIIKSGLNEGERFYVKLPVILSRRMDQEKES
jgi:HlyD family secretion protein